MRDVPFHFMNPRTTGTEYCLASANPPVPPGQENKLSYFSQPKGERDRKSLNSNQSEVMRNDQTSAKAVPEVVSILGPGMLVTGNVICAGSLQIFGRVIGDVHASRLLICEGAVVEGKIVSPELVVDGAFKGTIHGNSVKLQGTAMVEGEIFNRSLAIEQNAQFEGVARRLGSPVDAPSADLAPSEQPLLLSADVIPITGQAG